MVKGLALSVMVLGAALALPVRQQIQRLRFARHLNDLAAQIGEELGVHDYQC